MQLKKKDLRNCPEYCLARGLMQAKNELESLRPLEELPGFDKESAIKIDDPAKYYKILKLLYRNYTGGLHLTECKQTNKRFVMKYTHETTTDE